MAIYSPAGVASSRNRNAIWVDAISDVHSPKVAEVTSTTAALDISCWLNSDWDGFSAEQSKESDERWCGNKFESMGEVEYTVGDLVYVVDPQAATTDGTARASAFLTEGKRGFLVVRRGKSMDAPIIAGDKVDVLACQLGAPVPDKTGKNEPLRDRQAVAVIGQVARNVPIAA